MFDLAFVILFFHKFMFVVYNMQVLRFEPIFW